MKNMMISADEKKLLRKVEIRSHTCFLAATMVNMEGNGFTFSLIPAIEEIYKDDPEGKKEAYTRHQQFFQHPRRPILLHCRPGLGDGKGKEGKRFG